MDRPCNNNYYNINKNNNAGVQKQMHFYKEFFINNYLFDLQTLDGIIK